MFVSTRADEPNDKMAAVTLEELLKEVGVRPEILDESISDNHILVIASVLTSWRKVAAHLGLSEIDLDSLDQEGKSEQEKKLEALLKWKGRYAFKATYKKLIESLLSLAMADVAEKVCHLLKGMSPSSCVHSNSLQVKLLHFHPRQSHKAALKKIYVYV